MMLMMAAAVIGTIIAYRNGDIVYITGNNGFGLPSANEWITDRYASLWAGIAVNVLLALLLSYMNRRFNVLRTMSHLFVGMFMIMQGDSPPSWDSSTTAPSCVRYYSLP